METVTYGKITHLVSGKFQGTVTTQCGTRFESNLEFNHPSDVVPSCPKCLEHHFSTIKTNYYHQKQAAISRDRASKIINGLSMLIDFQQENYADDKCDEVQKGAYPFIPMGTNPAIITFEWLDKMLLKEKRWSGHKVSQAKFLDAGCGVGNMLLLASLFRLTDEYHGIEYFEDTAERARTWLGINNKRQQRYGKGKFNIFQDDILTFKDYGNYDIVYFYCPMIEARLQVRFEERLEDEMKVGSILVPRMKRGHMIADDRRFERISKSGSYDACYIKVEDGPRIHSEIKEIDKLKRSNAKQEASIKKLIKAGTIRT